MLDTSERDRALADLTVERSARRRAEQEAAEFKTRCQLLQAEVVQLRDEIDCLQSGSVVRNSSQNTTLLEWVSLFPLLTVVYGMNRDFFSPAHVTSQLT